MAEGIIVNPDPRRMIEGLRDTGYSFNTAVADLIDNSLAAEATNIWIWVKMDFRGKISLILGDDGIGMSRNELISAMKYGSPERPSPQSLGKFGLGLKTASTAFCRCLSVISRSSTDNVINKATWNLDHVAEEGKWELLLFDPTMNEIDVLNKIAPNHTGTLVVWEHVDRLLKEYAEPGGRFAQNALKRIIEELEEHIGMVYQRFLNPVDKRENHKAKIWLNDKNVEFWDPFCEAENGPEQVATQVVVSQDGQIEMGSFAVRAFILPRKEEFSTTDAAEQAKISNDRQGFYIYRENRLIHHADWLGMYSDEPHLSLLRVEFSFNANLDDAFQVDIKKSKITLNNSLYRWVKEEFLPPARRAAEDRYRKGQKKVDSQTAVGAHDSSNQNIMSKEKEIDQADIKVINAEKGEVDITNSEGETTRLVIKVETFAQKPGEVFVQPVHSIDDGLLWQPVLIEGHQGVQINMGHNYYHKVYLPNILDRDVPVGTIQGMDALLWALAIAELRTVNDQTKEHFNELRYEVSRILRKLVESLPEPPEKPIDEN